MKFIHRKFMGSFNPVKEIEHHYHNEVNYKKRYFFYQMLIWAVILSVLFLMIQFFKININLNQ